MLEIVYAILPIFLIIAAGILAERGGLLSASVSMPLSAYVLRLALPALLFRIMAGAEPSELFQGALWGSLIGAQVISYGIGYAGDRILKRRGVGPAAVTGMACSSSLTSFVGLPIIMNLLPGNREALVIAGLLTVMPILSIVLGQIQLESMRRREQPEVQGRNLSLCLVLMRAIFTNPLILSMLAGALLCLTGIGLWTPLDRAATLLGATAAPCALFSIGLSMRNQLRVGFAGNSGPILRHQAGVVSVKLLIQPLLTWGLLVLFGVDATLIAVCVIMSATGTAVGSYLVADAYKTVPEECAMSVVLTCAFSLLSLPAFSYLCKALGMI